MLIPIYRNGTEITSFKSDESTIYSYVLMGEHKITANITTRAPLPIQIGDYITYNGQNFYLNTVPTAQATDLLVYNLTFESIIYRLHDKILLDEGNMNFTYYGDSQLYVELVVNNINEIDSGWTVGTVEATSSKHIAFEGRVTCREALTKIAQEFGLEYYLIGKQINLVKQAGNTTSLTFKYGRQEGLYSLSRNYIDEKNIVTKVYGFGSDKNLPEGYRNGAKQLIFNEKFLTLNTDLYGIKEGVYEDTEVFPHRDGTVTAASAYSEGQTTFTITDTSLDFNINDYLLPGVVAKIVFKTGELSGYEFEITKYDHATKTITFKLYTDGTNYTIPNSTFSAAVGDRYTLVDIFMPQSYLDAAEAELKASTLEYLQENAVPRVAYSLEVDPLHIKSQNITLAPGDKVTVIDNRLGINTQIRVNSVSYPVGLYTDPLVNGKSFFKAEIADFVTYTIQERLIADTRDTKKEVKIVDRTNIKRATNIAKATAELATMLDTLRAEMLLIMVNGGNYTSNIVVETDVDGNPNKFKTEAGTINQLEYTDNGSNGLWNVSASSFTLPTSGPYYFYIRASRFSPVATVVYSATEIGVTDEAGMYHFPFGILSSVISNTRIFSSTKGYTRITGNNIHTGKIISNDGGTYIDLNTGEIKGRFTFTSGEDVETAVDNLNTAIETTNNYIDVVKADLQGQIDGQIMSWFYNYDPTLSNVPASDWTDTAEKEKHLGDLFYNNATGKAYRFGKNGSAYQWFLITDTDVTLALATANAAKDTADQKRRVFSGQPYTPYEVGDLWAPGTSGYTQKCVVARATGVFNAGDWVKADKATDDTAVNNLQIGGRNLILNSFINQDIGASGTFVLSRSSIPLKSGSYILSVKAYTTGGDNIVQFYKTDGSSYQNVFSFNNEYKVYSTIVDVPTDGVYAIRIGADHVFHLDWYKIELGTKATDWTPAPEDIQAGIDAAQTTATNASTAAANAQTSANTANNLLSDIASDSKLTGVEKQQTELEWQSIFNEKPTIDAQADAYSISRSNYDNTYTALNSYITPLLSSLTTTSDIVGDTFRSKFADYYNQRQLLLKAISDKAKQLADASQTTANGAATSAGTALTAAQAAQQATNEIITKTGISSLATGETIINGGMLNTDLINTIVLIVRKLITSGSNYMSINENDDNSFKIRHANGQVGIMIGIVDGEPKMVCYNPSGQKVWDMGTQGLTYNGETPETWTSESYFQISTSLGNTWDSNTIDTIKNIIRTSVCANASQTSVGIAPNTSAYYRYNAGYNANSSTNKQYNGLHTSQTKATTNFIPNGWYVHAGYESFSDYLTTESYTVSVVYISNGVEITQQNITDVPYQLNSYCPVNI